MTQIGKRTEQRRDPETYAIIGSAMMVHRTLGKGFLELVYQEALSLELGLQGIPHSREVEISIEYRGLPLSVRYRADFICFGGVLVELKATDRLTTVDDAQIINYLVATRLGRGLLLNFGASSLQYKRFAGPSGGGIQSAQSAQSVDPSNSAM